MAFVVPSAPEAHAIATALQDVVAVASVVSTDDVTSLDGDAGRLGTAVLAALHHRAQPVVWPLQRAASSCDNKQQLLQ